MTEANAPVRLGSAGHPSILPKLRAIVGRRHVISSAASMHAFTNGFRFGTGRALAVVRPGSLVELWRAATACIDAGAILILQAANTGLTGGSTPFGDYDRPLIVVNTTRIRAIYPINGGAQVLCLAGATLDALEQILKPYGREPHSVIGSSCIGASVIGGICNSSGGALIQRGPAFTQLALYGRITADRKLQLCNHLGVELGDTPEEILGRLDRGDFSPADIDNDPAFKASDHDYAAHVRDVEAMSAARFNADPRGLYEASGCAGRLIVFAVRMDSFDRPDRTAVFYLGTSDGSRLARVRRDVLSRFAALPIAAEYIHRDAFNLAERYGKDVFFAVAKLGTARLPAMFRLKAHVDRIGRAIGLGEALSDRLLQIVSRLIPPQLPARMLEYRDRFEHHLMIRVGGEGIAETRDYLARSFDAADAAHFECSAEEGQKAFLHRFVVAGAAVRYRAVHARTTEDIIALDIALPRNDRDWMETLPEAIEQSIVHKIYYGHFFCHVFHQDYIVAKGADTVRLKQLMLERLDARRAEYPAEHNVGHLYKAKPALADFYRELDPCNQLNPGIGCTPKGKDWHPCS